MEKHSSALSIRKNGHPIKPHLSVVVTTANSGRDQKKISNSLSSKQFVVNNNLRASVKNIRMNKVQSAINFEKKPLEKSRSNALNIFPKLNPEFYQESTPNFFWQKEMTRINSEKKFMERPNTTRNKQDGNSKIFYKSNIFEIKPKKKVDNITKEKTFKEPKHITISLYARERDYHSNANIFQSEKSKNFEDVNKRNANKAISPMHLKLYSSSMQNNALKISLPPSHPSYKKELPQKQIPQTTRKRLDLMRTSYNFLKNYF